MRIVPGLDVFEDGDAGRNMASEYAAVYLFALQGGEDRLVERPGNPITHLVILEVHPARAAWQVARRRGLPQPPASWRPSV